MIEFPWYFKKNFSFERVVYFDFNINILKVFSFGNHNAILNIVKDLNRPTKNRGKKVVGYSFYIEFFVYLTVMIIGYLSTFEETHEIFIDRHDQSFFLLFGKMFYVIALTCHIGMFYYISKPSLQVFLNYNNDFTEKQYTLFYIGTLLYVQFHLLH